MPRLVLSPEDQKFVNRWRLVVVAGYSSIIALMVVLAAALPSPSRDGRTSEARMSAADVAQPDVITTGAIKTVKPRNN